MIVERIKTKTVSNIYILVKHFKLIHVLEVHQRNSKSSHSHTSNTSLTDSLLSEEKSLPPAQNKKRYIKVEEKDGKVVGLAAALLKGNDNKKPANGLPVKDALKNNQSVLA